MLEDLQVRRRNNVVDKNQLKYEQDEQFKEDDSSILDYYGAKYGSSVQGGKNEEQKRQDEDYLHRYTSIHENAFKHDLQRGGNRDEDDIDPNDSRYSLFRDLQTHFENDEGIQEEFDMHRRSERTGVITNEMDNLAQQMQNTDWKEKLEKVESNFKKDQDDGPSDKPQMLIVNDDGEDMDESEDKVADLPDKMFDPSKDRRRGMQSVVVDSTAAMRGIPFEDQVSERIKLMASTSRDSEVGSMRKTSVIQQTRESLKRQKQGPKGTDSESPDIKKRMNKITVGHEYDERARLNAENFIKQRETGYVDNQIALDKLEREVQIYTNQLDEQDSHSNQDQDMAQDIFAKQEDAISKSETIS